MGGDIHAILMIVCIVGAAAAILALPRRKPSDKQLLAAILTGLLAMAIAVVTNIHLCWEGTPRTQWQIDGVLLVLVLALVGPTRWRRIVAGAMFLATIGLSCHFTELVHTGHWTGNAHWLGLHGREFAKLRATAQTIASEVEGDDDLPAQWARDLPISESLSRDWNVLLLTRREIHAVWHTWLTRLYRYETIQQDVWYPGGRLRDGLAKLELRDREP